MYITLIYIVRIFISKRSCNGTSRYYNYKIIAKILLITTIYEDHFITSSCTMR